MSSPPDAQAKHAWHHATKQRKHLIKQIAKLKTESSNGTNLSHFDNIGEVLEQYRLACVSAIFTDFTYAASESVEDSLWQVHGTINAEFRQILSRLKHNSLVVERRKVETKYNHFLRIAQQFYKGYIQRLSARYDVPELKRVAQNMGTEQMSTVDTISPVPADLGAMVLKSCHLTLIYLGDLARYRVQAKHKKSGYETALACYALAHDLIPDSGFPFHQMGIINLEEGNHLDVVYHFYRAWAVKEPHPNAKQNLEAKFKTLQASSLTGRGRPSSSGPHDAFIMWFVRLQALFYKGAPVSSQHTELDKEVIHRLSMAAKDQTCAPVLFKMSLVNMAAFCIAAKNYSEVNSEAASRFCHYILNFNIRFICKLCESLEAELRDVLRRRQENAESLNGTEPSTTSRTAESLLPTLRVYCMWLAAHRNEIFSAAEVLGSVLPSMLRSFAKIITLLTAETYSQENLATCPYLLTEDLEIRGLRSFDEDQISAACRAHCTEDGKLKPHLKEPKDRLPPQREFAARILDALRCAYNLAEDPNIPLTTRVVNGWLVFEYQAIPVSVQAQKEMEAPASTVTGADIVATHVNGTDSTPARSLAGKNNPSDLPFGTVPSPLQNIDQLSEDRAAGRLDDADKTVVNMLSPFLEDPTPESENANSSAEPSYGMHTATANELAQELLAKFEPEHDAATRWDVSSETDIFGPGTWEWKFPYTPTPPRAHELSAHPANGLSISNHGSNQSSRTSLPVTENLEDPFSTSKYMPRSAMPQGTATNPPGRTTIHPSVNEDAHRSHLLQAFTASSARRSPSTNWTASPWGGDSRARAAPDASPWDSWDQRWQQIPPISSNTSAFTHPSSLYQGTPNDGHAFGATGNGTYGNNQTTVGGTPENAPLSYSRHLQMDKTASSYDAAILQAAWQGK